MPMSGIADFHLSALLHPSHVIELQHYFCQQQSDGTNESFEQHEQPQVSLAQFTKVLKKVLGPSTIPETQIARIFHRIDANSDGTVTWDEWCDFFLMFDQRHINLYRDTHATTLQPSDGYSGRDASIAIRRGLIVHILAMYVPLELLKPPTWLYVTCAQNGTISLWEPTSLTVLDTLAPRSSTAWVTNMIALSMTDFVAVGTVDHSLEIVRLSTMLVVESISPLPFAAVGMTSFRNADGEHMLAFGDMGGYLNIHKMKIQQRGGNVELSAPPKRYRVHEDWITQVAYIAAYRYLITSSMDSTIKFTNLSTGVVQRQFDRHRTGVYTFYYAPQLNLMASSGSRNVFLWNPDQMDVLASLKGHASPVHQMSMDERSYKLFTLSLDKVFKVWDCYTYQCMQTILDPMLHFPDNHIGRIFWDARLQQLVSSTTRLRVWPIHDVLQSNTRTSHDCSITCATYTSALHQVATGDVNSAIHTWDGCTGELVMRIPRAHGTEQITVLAYDPNGKRVMSGAVDGTVNIWNGSNGQLLSRLHRSMPGSLEISAIVYVVPSLTAKSLNQDRYIIVSGWDRQLVKYKDTKSLDIYPHEVFGESIHVMPFALFQFKHLFSDTWG
ncbi:hypothetical protein LEN26_001790 [Aphanomyces euteiches]|nr:hypothetical protein LEN26_001790 [Aphanomyces euteiches]